MRINLIGQVYGCMGIPNHTRDLFKAIVDHNPSVNIYPLSPNFDPYDLEGIQGNIVNGNWQAGPKLEGVTFIFWTPDIYPQLLSHIARENSIVVGYPIFEWTRFTPAFRDSLNQMDYCAFSSTWAKDTAISNGILDSKTLVINAGVNRAFLPNSFDHSIPAPHQRPNSYLYIAKFEKRKAVQECLKSFVEAFPSGDQKLDVLLTDPHDPNFNADKAITAIVGDKARKTFNLIERQGKISEMVALYRSHRFILVPSRAGGTELPMIEAMAQGCIPLVTNYGGMTSYFPVDYRWAIPVKELRPMYDDRWYKPTLNWGVWAEPDWNEFKHLLQQTALQTEEELITDQHSIVGFIMANCSYSEIGHRLVKGLDYAWRCKKEGAQLPNTETIRTASQR